VGWLERSETQQIILSRVARTARLLVGAGKKAGERQGLPAASQLFTLWVTPTACCRGCGASAEQQEVQYSAANHLSAPEAAFTLRPHQIQQQPSLRGRAAAKARWDREVRSARPWQSSVSLVMPLITRHGQTAFQATSPPAWGKAKFATSHPFRDAPRDDSYCWRGIKSRVVRATQLLLNSCRCEERWAKRLGRKGWPSRRDVAILKMSCLALGMAIAVNDLFCCGAILLIQLTNLAKYAVRYDN